MRKKVHKRKHIARKVVKHKKFHHKVISFLKGDGGIYTIFILATAMAGAFALTGGILPQLNPEPSATSQVEIDPNSAKQSSESALQLVDIKPKPTATPTLAPTITSPPEPLACLNKTAILVLLDLSASMQFDGKIEELKKAMQSLQAKLRSETAIGIYGFGSFTGFSARGKNGVKELVPLNKYRDNQDEIDPAISSLSYGSLGGTYLRNGVSLAIDRLQAAKLRTSYFKDYQYVTLVFSDGVPERSGSDIATDVNLGACAPYHSDIDYQKCFAREQDPRGYVGQSDLTASLKEEGKVYSVVIYDQRTSEDDSYFVSPRDSQDRLRTLMKSIASKNSYYYDLEVRGLSKLETAFTSIINGVCSE